MSAYLNHRAPLATLVLLLLPAVLSSSPTLAPKEQDFLALAVHEASGKVTRYRAYPASAVNLLFPDGEAILEPDATPEKWEHPLPVILSKVRLARLYDTQRRFSLLGVAFGDRLFIFDELFSRDNSAVMSRLMRATSSSPRNVQEAFDLAKLYLAFSYFRLQDPARFIANESAGSEGLPAREHCEGFEDRIGLLHSRQIVQQGANYHLDFFTDASPDRSAKIDHWQIDLNAGALTERLSAHHMGFRAPECKSGGEVKRARQSPSFTVGTMANGSGDDGATLDLQSWESSDGPGISRIHFYYPSHQQAENRMNTFLKQAVAILKMSPWLDSDGKIAGRQALVILASNDKKFLYASHLFEGADSVLEISCASLANLMAVEGRPPEDWKR